MFYYIIGTVTYIESNLAVIEAGGIGYACTTTVNTLSQLNIGESAKLFTYLNVKEDGIELFGFISLEELNHFKLLISVSGVGPKAAISILSSVDPAGLALAVISNDEKVLTSAPGVGKKIAQRIILELKDKMQKMSASSSSGFSGNSVSLVNSNNLHEATAALTVLGYSPQEINTTLKSIKSDGLSTEAIIRQALKLMAK